MCFAIQSETQLGCHYQRGRLHLCGPSLLAFPLDHHQHGRSCASQHGRLRHLLFPRSGSKGMGRGSLPKALASQRHSLPLTSQDTFVPSSPLLPSHRSQLASLEPFFTYLKSCYCSPVLLPGSPPPRTIPAAWAQHTLTRSSWGG